MLRIVPHTVPGVGRSYELFPDGFELHLLLRCGDRGSKLDTGHAVVGLWMGASRKRKSQNRRGGGAGVGCRV